MASVTHEHEFPDWALQGKLFLLQANVHTAALALTMNLPRLLPLDHRKEYLPYEIFFFANLVSNILISLQLFLCHEPKCLPTRSTEKVTVQFPVFLI